MCAEVLTDSNVCQCVIDMRAPCASERVRGFQPPWHTVYIYTCPACGAKHRLNAQHGLGPGGFYCGAPLTTANPL